MDKLMNKMDVMELDMVAGGRMGTAAPPDRDHGDNIFTDFYKFAKKGAKSVGSVFGRFFRMARECRDKAL